MWIFILCQIWKEKSNWKYFFLNKTERGLNHFFIHTSNYPIFSIWAEKFLLSFSVHNHRCTSLSKGGKPEIDWLLNGLSYWGHLESRARHDFFFFFTCFLQYKTQWPPFFAFLLLFVDPIRCQFERIVWAPLHNYLGPLPRASGLSTMRGRTWNCGAQLQSWELQNSLICSSF